MTRRSRGIHAAWHFWFAVIFGGESGLRKLGLCGIHPLTRRYVTVAKTALGNKSRYRSGKDQCSGISNN
ncbi:DUF3265 domain-containing protein [Vibrio vulnificus]|nr:DUF3265 domain-containing protein [Vibrio vulnificus]EGQ9330410.1 DUF3265 domain-containing protein [Vibrio vulnificus]EGQ9784574.1 DUF3265 domain-containing protein [Vibrio vulnificus]EGR0089344.1 DUF3265 domain-containing protein [Vibrio vulnificus]EGR0106893.1 DUF3265 domain-containing protein [Vibrio vulnificus]EHV9861601.1 DUF3265 domain-containing protein [Vibrio vulnificus]